jgi:heme/copper-type cytochrome/quinol oxidase subunit 3
MRIVVIPKMQGTGFRRKKMSSIQRHPYHLVDASPWPIVSSLSALVTATGAAMFMHSFQNGEKILFLGLFMVISSMSVWWRDVIREATFNGYHTKTVQYGLRMGMILFIVSEVMFFFAFFWAFFHSSLSPAIEIGSVWPPESINPFDPWGVPLLNTVILLLSGSTVTWAHHEILAGRKGPALGSLLLTLALAVAFTGFQVLEYLEASFNISDGVYGSTFFMATGFHGFHVIIGTIFLTVCYIRLAKNHFTTSHHLGFEAAAWYWHFVDVVWLFLFVVVYWW